MKASPRFAELALAFVCLLWGSTFVLVKNALDDISPPLFLAIRFSIASVLLAIVYLARRNPVRIIVDGRRSDGSILCTQAIFCRHSGCSTRQHRSRAF